MKNYLLILVCVFIILVLGIAFFLLKSNTNKDSINGLTNAKQEQSFGIVTIKMQDGTFVPEKITIRKNQTVVFLNESKDNRWPASNIHPTHQIYSEFDPKKPILPKASWSFKFDKVGIWRFHDHLFPRLTGVIIVEE